MPDGDCTDTLEKFRKLLPILLREVCLAFFFLFFVFVMLNSSYEILFMYIKIFNDTLKNMSDSLLPGKNTIKWRLY